MPIKSLIAIKKFPFLFNISMQTRGFQIKNMKSIQITITTTNYAKRNISIFSISYYMNCQSIKLHEKEIIFVETFKNQKQILNEEKI